MVQNKEYVFCRYEKYWIPLILSCSPDFETDLTWSPPLDVAWVWHVHMLAPHHYRLDLSESPLKRIINHQPKDPLSQVAINKRKQTAIKWSQLYPDVPFDIDLNNIVQTEEFVSSFSYNIVEASSRQKLFYYQVLHYLLLYFVMLLNHFTFQVSLPHFTDRTFLSAGISRYAKFLYLKQTNPDVFLVPCYDIDIVWHTHQV